MPKIDEQIEAIEQKMEQHRNRLRDLKAQATKQERRDDARRKLLYGAAYLTALEALPGEKQQRSREHIEAHITRPKDREFLGLKPLPASRNTNTHG
ncbi:hypothetical protein [Limimaricola soesokkakensis]|uniref:hypothetical protein n=1 Tax=Limimaricola soesokkakensis TaxID=1343159 RepID=UPI003516EF17